MPAPAGQNAPGPIEPGARFGGQNCARGSLGHIEGRFGLEIGCRLARWRASSRTNARARGSERARDRGHGGPNVPRGDFGQAMALEWRAAARQGSMGSGHAGRTSGGTFARVAGTDYGTDEGVPLPGEASAPTAVNASTASLSRPLASSILMTASLRPPRARSAMMTTRPRCPPAGPRGRP